MKGVIGAVPQIGAVPAIGAVPQIRGSVFSPIPQAGASVSLPISQNAVVQRIPQAVVQQIPQTGVSVSLPISQTRNTIVQQIPQTEGAVGGAVGGAIGGMVGVATGAVPRPGNPYYLPEMEYPERILSSTPRGQNLPISTMTILGQDISTIPNLTPHLKTPPGFSYPQHEQGFIQAQPNTVNSNIRNGRLVRNLENNLINLEDAIGDATVSNRTQRVPADQNRNIHVHTPGTFNPIKGIDTLPITVPG